MHEAEVWLEGTPSSVATARRFVADVLTEAGARDELWPAVQVVSELATNAVVHARTSFLIRVSVGESVVRVTVVDKQPLVPVARGWPSGDTTTGRGLRLVEMLSRDWGVDSDRTAKMVWCEIEHAPAGNGRGTLEVGSGDDAAIPPSTAVHKPRGRREPRAVAAHRVA